MNMWFITSCVCKWKHTDHFRHDTTCNQINCALNNHSEHEQAVTGADLLAEDFREDDLVGTGIVLRLESTSSLFERGTPLTADNNNVMNTAHHVVCNEFSAFIS